MYCFIFLIRKKTIMDFDELDKKLLTYLQEDAKQNTKELAYKVGLSVTAVYERIKNSKKMRS